MNNESKNNNRKGSELIILIIILIIVLLMAILFLIYKHKKENYERNRELIMSKWRSETGFVIDIHNIGSGDIDPSYLKQCLDKHSNVMYDFQMRDNERGGVGILNYEELLSYFNLSDNDKNIEETVFYIPLEYSIKQKHQIEINGLETNLYIDDLKPNSFTMSDEFGNKIKFVRE